MKRSAGLAILLTGTGCSLIVDSSGLARGTPDAAVDGGPTSDAGSDGAVSDAAGNEGGGRFCDGQGAHALCADFDDPDKSAWTSSFTGFGAVGGALGVDGAGFRSAPYALLATLDRNAGGTTFKAAAYKNFAPAPSTISCSFDFRLDVTSPNSQVGVLDMGFDSAVIESALDETGSLSHDGMAGGVVAKGAWVHWDVSFTRTPAPLFKVSLDGVQVHQHAPTNLPTGPSLGMVSFGYSAESGTYDGWQVRFDNVVCDGK